MCIKTSFDIYCLKSQHMYQGLLSDFEMYFPKNLIILVSKHYCRNVSTLNTLKCPTVTVDTVEVLILLCFANQKSSFISKKQLEII